MKIVQLKSLAVVIVLLSVLYSCSKSEVDVYGNIHGIVSDFVSGEPIKNASVTLIPSGKTSVTGSDGSYQYDGLTSMQYTVQVGADAYLTNVKTVLVEPGVTARADIQLKVGEQGLYANPMQLDFGGTKAKLDFLLYNEGAEDIIWNLDYTCDWISGVSPKSGSLRANSNQKITLTVDRTKLKKEVDETLLVISANSEERIGFRVGIKKYTGNDGGDNNDEDDVPAVSNGLYVHYPFESNTKNATETLLDAVPVNQPTYVVGSADGSTAIRFTNNSYITIPEALLDKTQSSISFWAKGLGDGHIFSLTNNENIDYYTKSFVLYMRNGQLVYTLHHGKLKEQHNTLPAFDHTNIADNKWHMITITTDASTYSSTVKLYIDGILSATQNDIGELASGSKFGKCTGFTMGGSLKVNNSATLNAIGMSVDNLRVYNSRVLSATEVKQIFDAEKK